MEGDYIADWKISSTLSVYLRKDPQEGGFLLTYINHIPGTLECEVARIHFDDRYEITQLKKLVSTLIKVDRWILFKYNCTRLSKSLKGAFRDVIVYLLDAIMVKACRSVNGNRVHFQRQTNGGFNKLTSIFVPQSNQSPQK